MIKTIKASLRYLLYAIVTFTILSFIYSQPVFFIVILLPFIIMGTIAPFFVWAFTDIELKEAFFWWK